MSAPNVCSFCGLGETPPRVLILGPDANICSACVDICNGRLGRDVVRTAPRPLTRRQHAIYSYLEKYIEANGFAPSFEEIAVNFGYASLATVHEHLIALERKGWISRRYNESRSITLLSVAA